MNCDGSHTVLFPSTKRTPWEDSDLDGSPGTTVPFTVNELLLSASRLPRGKAPGLDQVPNEIVTAAVKARPALLLELLNKCLTTRRFPSWWKSARLVLIRKNHNKPPDEPSSYRPLSLLDGADKLLERILLSRMDTHLSTPGCLSDLQFGFRRGRSTLDALRVVTDQVDMAARDRVQDRHLCTVISLDVRNAFHSAPWAYIETALRRREFPTYIIRIVRSYLF